MFGGSSSAPGFRIRLFLFVVLVLAGLTVCGAAFAHAYFLARAEREFHESFRGQVQATLHAHTLRKEVLVGICRDLTGNSRIQAAFEDDAMDLLYPSAEHELQQLMEKLPPMPSRSATSGLRARFYRFLGPDGQLLEPENPSRHGILQEQWRSVLARPRPPMKIHTAYLAAGSDTESNKVVELIVAPVISRQTFQPLGALVVGFPLPLQRFLPPIQPMELGLWTEGRLLGATMPAGNEKEETFSLPETPYALQKRTLNSHSAYPETEAVFATPLTLLRLRQEQLRNHIFVAAGLFLLFGLLAANYIAVRFSRPVKALAEVSEKEHAQRLRAETALDTTNRDLERAARFSADASHQLKTPVAVVRAGLEELLKEEGLRPEAREEIGCLLQQTSRLTRVIEDLLLLSRMDAGALAIQKKAVDLRLLVDELLDDLSIEPDKENLQITVDIPVPCTVAGDRMYTSLLLQTLLENARKYNRPGGSLRVWAESDGGSVQCLVGNTGRPIPENVRKRIFERFHRGHSGENVSGYGLGLNLAKELARLHGGFLELRQSEADWTEFALRLPALECTYASTAP